MVDRRPDRGPVELEGVERRFGARQAVASVDLRVERGQVVGVAGPNGSGKTTLLRLTAGFLAPDRGSVRIFGEDPRRERMKVMRRARFAFAPPALLDELTPREHLRHFARSHGEELDGRRALEVLERVELADRADDRVRTFSFGMRQRLTLALCLVPEPELLVLDEPTDGLDPLGLEDLAGLLLRLRRECGTAILLSSHQLGDLEDLVDRLWILREGRVAFRGTPRELCSEGEVLFLGVRDPARAAEHLARRGLAAAPAPGGVHLAPDALELGAAQRLLAEIDEELASFTRVRPSLEGALRERLRRARGARGAREQGGGSPA